MEEIKIIILVLLTLCSYVKLRYGGGNQQSRAEAAEVGEAGERMR